MSEWVLSVDHGHYRKSLSHLIDLSYLRMEWNGLHCRYSVVYVYANTVLYAKKKEKNTLPCQVSTPTARQNFLCASRVWQNLKEKTRPKQNKMKQKKIMGNWTEHNAYTRKPTHISYMDSIFMWADKIGSKIVQRCNDAPYRATRCSHCVHSHNMTVFKTSRLHNVRSKIKHRQKCGQFTWNNTKRVFAVAQ